MMELLLPRHCAGCGAFGETMCRACRRSLVSPPKRVFTPVDPHVPVWALGNYSGVHRELVLGVKERGRRDVPPFLGAVLRSAVDYLAARGEVPDAQELALVPAPTRAVSARLRGGDPVTLMARASGISVMPCVRHGAKVRDSAGLSAAERRRNLQGAVELTAIPSSPVLIVDDVVTTGSTLAATTAVLFAAKVQVVGALSICVA